MNQDKSKLRYIMYCRKSSDSEDRQVQSIPDQKRELEPLISKHQLKVVKVFGESQSAKSPGRPDFNEMVRMLEQGKADGIICWKVNRLARNPIDGGKIQWLLQQGIIQSIITPAKEYLSSDNVLMMAMELGIANQYSIDLGIDVTRGMKSKVVKGWKPGRAPLGYLNDPSGDKGEKQIFADSERFNIVRKMWDTLLSGMYTVPQIVAKATDEWGLRTKKTKRITGRPLSIGGAYRMFTNPFYYGEFSYKGEAHQGKHEPMITREEFDLAQRILGRAGKPRSKHKDLPFNGVIQCGECGSMYTADERTKLIKQSGKLKSFMYHRCTKRRKGAVCHQQPIKHEDLVKQIRQKLDTITIPPEFLQWAIEVLRSNSKLEEATRTTILANHQKNYDAVLKRIDNLINMYICSENAARDMLTEEEYKAQKGALMVEKAKIEAAIRKVEQDVNKWVELTEQTFDFATYAKTHFDRGGYEQKTHILQALGKNFTFMDGKLSIELQKPLLIIKNGLEAEPLKTARLGLAFHGINAMNETKNRQEAAVYSIWSG